MVADAATSQLGSVASLSPVIASGVRPASFL